MLSFLQVAALLPVAELAERRSAAKRYFAGHVTPAGWDWAKTQTDFVTLLSPGILNGTHRWLQRARLWRLILSQSTEGWFDATSNTAFVCEARAAADTEGLQPTLMSRVSAALSVAASMAFLSNGDGLGGLLDGQAAALNDDDHARASDPGRAQNLAANEEAAGRRSTSLRRAESMERAASIADCPLTCSAAAITASIPRQLRSLDASIKVSRVWATLCCIAVLERFPASWVWGDGDLYQEKERTIVDGAREWVESYAEQHPALAAALQDGTVQERARRITSLWRCANERRVAELRRSPAIRNQISRSHVHRCGCTAARGASTSSVDASHCARRTLTAVLRAITTQHQARAAAGWNTEAAAPRNVSQLALCVCALPASDAGHVPVRAARGLAALAECVRGLIA